MNYTDAVRAMLGDPYAILVSELVLGNFIVMLSCINFGYPNQLNFNLNPWNDNNKYG